MTGLCNAVIIALCLFSLQMETVQVSPDRRGFQLTPSGRRFIPWGFNYDHDERGRLIEDYWVGEWSKIEGDFLEMKGLGANVVRVHLQFGRFMDGPDRPDRRSLRQLRRLVELAERLGIYLDITGLGCYHRHEVPTWYDKLSEGERWEAQSVFWEAVAATCADSPAVFCYDLMNEPVAPGEKRRDDWLGPAFAGKHFVQFIALETKGRKRTEIARQWIRRLVAAIRRYDRQHLITVGLVPWSLDRPGLTSGFVPERIADELDFIAVHIYPEKGKVDRAVEMLRAFSVGKPVLVEEMFPLRCSVEELEEFIDRSKGIAAGWLGFYWGRTPEEYRQSEEIRDRLMLRWLDLFQRKRLEIP